MDNIQLYYIDNEINKIDKMKQGDVIYKNGVELLVVLSYDHNEPCKGCFFYEDKACGSERLIKCWDCKVDNTATSSYWMLTNEYMVDKFDYAKGLQPYKGMGLCSECGRLATSPDGRDVVVPGKWHGKFPKEKATEEQLKKVGYKNLIR